MEKLAVATPENCEKHESLAQRILPRLRYIVTCNVQLTV